jgi:hypothetical protein
MALIAWRIVAVVSKLAFSYVLFLLGMQRNIAV